jgi:hypothetical protein
MEHIKTLQSFGGELSFSIMRIYCHYGQAIGRDSHKTDVINGFKIGCGRFEVQTPVFDPQQA